MSHQHPAQFVLLLDFSPSIDHTFLFRYMLHKQIANEQYILMTLSTFLCVIIGIQSKLSMRYYVQPLENFLSEWAHTHTQLSIYLPCVPAPLLLGIYLE
jgi:hypothetical protein